MTFRTGATPTMTTLQPGMLLDERFELVRLVPTGGAFGSVWLATDRKSAASHVRVVVLENPSPTPERQARFFELASKWHSIERNPHVLAMLHAGVWGGWFYMAHPVLDGIALNDWLRTLRDQKRSLSLATVRDIAACVLDALEAAHGLTPEPLFHQGLSTRGVTVVVPSGEVVRQLVVADFGLVHFDPPPTTESSHDRLAHNHLAPEQERPPHQAFPQTDVFQVARLVVECLTGRTDPPSMPGSSWSRFTEAGVRQTVNAIRAARRDLPPEVCTVLASALHRFPTSRPKEIKAFRESLLRAWGPSSEETTTPLLAEHFSARPSPAPAAPSSRPPTMPPRGVMRASTAAPRPRSVEDTAQEVGREGQVFAARYRLGAANTDEDGCALHRTLDMRTGAEVWLVLPPEAVRGDVGARACFYDTWKLNTHLLNERAHVLSILDLGEDPRTHAPFVVTESLSGPRLDELLVRQGPMPVPQMLECARTIASVLAEAEIRSFVHGDLRPERLQFYTADARVLKLRSFGPARVAKAPARLGAGYFRAPEHASPSGNIGAGADVWSFGLLMYAMLAGHHVVGDAENLLRMYREGIDWIRPRPSDHLTVAGLRLEDFDRWLSVCVRPNVNERFPSVAVAERELRAVCARVGPVEVPPTPPDPAPPSDDPRPSPRSRFRPPTVVVPRAAPTVPKDSEPGQTLQDPESVKPIELQRHQKPLRGLAASSDGMRLVSASVDGTILVWDMNRREVERELLGHDGTVQAVAITADGARVFSGGQDRSVRIWNLRDPEAEPVALNEHQSVVQAVAMTRNGRYAVSGSSDEHLCYWDLQPGREHLLWKARAHDRATHCVAVTADGQRVVSGGEDGVVCLWDARGMQLAQFNDHVAPVRAIAISPDGREVFSGDEQGYVVCWDVESGQRSKFKAHKFRITSLVLTSSAEGSRLVSGSCDPNVKVWDPTRERCLHTLERHEVAVWSVAAGPDVRWVFSGDSDGLICVWPLG